MMKIHATIQVRMGSSRLPGKALKEILGQPMLGLQIQRIQQSRLIDEIILATSTEPQDDPISELADRLGVHCYRGSENDVLGRVLGALSAHGAKLNVEFQGDNPMPDAILVDSIVGFYLKNQAQFDYVTNSLKTTFPPGMEVSVYPTQVLERAEKLVQDNLLREHVGLHIINRPDQFRIHNLEAPEWFYEPDLHLEVDEPADFEVVKKIFEHFYPTNPGFGLAQIIEHANEIGLKDINSGVNRRWREFRDD